MIAAPRDRFLSVDEVMNMTSFSKTTIYRNIAKGTFPKPRKLGPLCVRWKESEVLVWMDSFPEIDQNQVQN